MLSDKEKAWQKKEEREEREVAALRLDFQPVLVGFESNTPFFDSASNQNAVLKHLEAEWKNIMIVNHRQALTGTGLLFMTANTQARVVCKIGAEHSVIDYETVSELET